MRGWNRRLNSTQDLDWSGIYSNRFRPNILTHILSSKQTAEFLFGGKITICDFALLRYSHPNYCPNFFCKKSKRQIFSPLSDKISIFSHPLPQFGRLTASPEGGKY